MLYPCKKTKQPPGEAGGFEPAGLKVQLLTDRLRSRLLNIEAVIRVSLKMMCKVLLDHFFGKFTNCDIEVSSRPEMSPQYLFFTIGNSSM
jgi:hypothetical protein